MSTQGSLTETAAVATFATLLRAHATATRKLNALLLSEHGLTLSDYEVLLRLAHAPERRLRRVDLAEQVVLSASGITRLLDGLEAAGYVERGECPSDRRVVYAVLTEAGRAKLREAQRSHVAHVEALFAERLDDAEVAQLGELLGKLGEGPPGACVADG
ncbi:MAG: MarR family transcriptional regulator [Thermoleophilia bacterium]|nr:MarR family transcriptional regulator [Gaiellaceae bacterium]MDW8338965.1 MarR family transcriptional regulator [Thermoleophilia bacterium]